MVQLAPHHRHRGNAAERAVRTFNINCVTGLASVDNNFPIYLWCRIVKQAEITINLLITSIENPRLSAYVKIFGKFDFNATPMVPPGEKNIAHEKPTQCATWSKHGVSGWYTGSAL